MRIVLVHRYFWPDTPPYAHLLREVAVALGEAGHEVTVLTCQPSYNRAVISSAPPRERLAQRVEVRRWSVLPDRRSAVLKGLNLVWFCLRLVGARAAFRRADVVMAASTPPIAVAKLSRVLAARGGARFVYHKQDIYPEVATAPGIMRDGKWAAALRRVDAATERRADRVVVLSADMARTVHERKTASEQITVINNFDPWQLDDEQDPVRAHDGDGVLRVVFAGNLGRFQNLETVFHAIRMVRDDEQIAFHFFGTGALAPLLERQIAEQVLPNVVMHGYCLPDEVARFIRDEADLGIVSLAPGVIRAAYPSKTMSYLRHGCPVLALVEPDSELALDLVDAGAGFHADPTDAASVATALRSAAADQPGLKQAREHARLLYESRFAPNRQLASWLSLFEGLQPGGTGGKR